MFAHRDQDFLLRQIHAFAAGILRQLGLATAEETEEDLDLLEKESESLLGFPFDVVRTMSVPGLIEFLSSQGELDPERALLLGLLFARRASAADQGPSAEAGDLRLRALALLGRAVEQKPTLLDDHVGDVLRAVSAQMGREARR